MENNLDGDLVQIGIGWGRRIGGVGGELRWRSRIGGVGENWRARKRESERERISSYCNVYKQREVPR